MASLVLPPQQRGNNAPTGTATSASIASPPPLPSSMPDSLSQSSPSDALLHLSLRSQSNALRLAKELSQSLKSNNNSEHSNSDSKSSSSIRNLKNQKQNQSNKQFYPIDLPPILQKRTKTKSKFHYHSHHHNEDPLTTSKACTESILTSLTKVASGGSAASTSLRNLEQTRRQTDLAANDLSQAIILRRSSNEASDALGAQLYADAARAVNEYGSVNASKRAIVIAGPHAVRAHDRTVDVLQRTILERFENAVQTGDLKELSNLTPLLGLLNMADKGVGLYLKFAQENLSIVMNAGLEQDEQVENAQKMEQAEIDAGMVISRAEARRREGKEVVTACTKLAKIYNAAVTFLRHHLPMVAYSLGQAEGDAALVQLIHAEVERRATDVIRQYIIVKKLSKLGMRSSGVANAIEEKYLSGDGMQYDQKDLFDLDSSITSGGNIGSTTEDKKNVLELMDDCGFKADLGSFVHVNASLDELALLLQHTESYERFIRHAVDEVNKARKLRKEQMWKERKAKWMQELENEGKDVTIEEAAKFDEQMKQFDKNQRVQDVLPHQTQLNDIVVETGGYYSGLERTFLLGSLQRALQSVNISDNRSYSPITILPPNRPLNAAGCNALQTSVVEECLYAAQRSTLRAFATGQSATASAASNFCADILGRFLLEVLVHRADSGTLMLKPGDGLLPGQSGLGQAALTMMSSAQKGLSKATTKGLIVGNSQAEERVLVRQRIQEGIAMSCAKLNDLEVAIDYTMRLEKKLLQEVSTTFPPGKKETEQLNACIKSLAGAQESFQSASNEAIDHLASTLMPRVRSIVNESVGQDNTTTTGFMGGGTVPGTSVRMNYHLDDEAYEMAQLSEGYISRLCQSLHDLVNPLRAHLAPRLSDNLLLGVIGGASKRLEGAIKRSQFTPLGALSLDSDIRFFVNFVKERFDSPNLSSSVTLYRACNPLARLAQISLLMNVDDLEDVLDLISSSKRKQMWDISLSDAKAFLNLRVDFEGRKVNELLQISD